MNEKSSITASPNVSLAHTPTVLSESEIIERIKKKVQPQSFELRDAAALSEEIEKRLARPNVITREAFKEYEVLYRAKPETFPSPKAEAEFMARIDRLSKKYRANFDMYKDTHIIASASDRRILIVLPPLFTQVRSIPPGEKGDAAVVQNYQNRDNQMPRIKSEAEAGMTNLFLSEQKTNEQIQHIAKSRRHTHLLLDLFRAQKEGRVRITSTTEQVAASNPDPKSNVVDHKTPVSQDIVGDIGGEEDFE